MNLSNIDLRHDFVLNEASLSLCTWRMKQMCVQVQSMQEERIGKRENSKVRFYLSDHLDYILLYFVK